MYLDPTKRKLGRPHLIFCKQCGTFIDEVPGEFHAQRRGAAARVLDATSNALDVIIAMTSKEAVTDYSPEAVKAILSAFNDRSLLGKPLSRPWRILTPRKIPQHP